MSSYSFTSVSAFSINWFWILPFHSYLNIYLCCINCHFSSDMWCRTFFHILICNLSVFFGEVSVKICCLILNWTFCFIMMDILDIFVYFGEQSFIKYVLWKVFSQSDACLLIPFTALFSEHQLQIFKKYTLLVFSWIALLVFYLKFLTESEVTYILLLCYFQWYLYIFSLLNLWSNLS